MTEKDRAELDAEGLLPCDGRCDFPNSHYEDCPAHYRPAVAAKLRELYAQIALYHSQAKAWGTVVAALEAASPGFLMAPGSGQECAVRAIEKLKAEIEKLQWEKKDLLVSMDAEQIEKLKLTRSAFMASVQGEKKTGKSYIKGSKGA